MQGIAILVGVRPEEVADRLQLLGCFQDLGLTSDVAKIVLFVCAVINLDSDSNSKGPETQEWHIRQEHDLSNLSRLFWQ